MMTLDRTRPGVAGDGRRHQPALRSSSPIEYSKERVQFGVPIAMHQAIQFMIADMATKIEAARLMTWKSAVAARPGSAQHARSPRTPSASPLTPRWRSPIDAVQVYGGYGFIKEYPVEKLMRDAKIMQLYEGTSQIQRLVIAREVLMPRRDPAPTTPEVVKETAGVVA